MGCLSVHIERVGASPLMSVVRIGGMVVDIKHHAMPIEASVKDISKRINGEIEITKPISLYISVLGGVI